MLNSEEVLSIILVKLDQIFLLTAFIFLRRGYYPRGGGEVELQVSPVSTLSPINVTLFGSLKRIWGVSYVAGVLPLKVNF